MNLIIWSLPIREYLSSYYSCDRIKSGICSLFEQDYDSRPFVYRVLVGRAKVFVAIRTTESPIGEPPVGSLSVREEHLPAQGEKYDLSMLSNPIVQKAKDGKSKRVPLIKKEDIEEWFVRSLDRNGFGVEKQEDGSLWVSSSACSRNEAVSGEWYINTCTVKARVFVKDETKAVEAFKRGIGKERKYGYGMLCLMPCTSTDSTDEEND